MPSPHSPKEEGFDLAATGDDDGGLSLDALTDAFAEMLGGGSDPYDKSKRKQATAEHAPPTADDVVAEAQIDEATDTACDISPRSILEAMLFVGHPDNEPLTSRQVAALMRGVRPPEVDDLVRQLNADYEETGCPYTIASVGDGYRMTLRDEFSRLRDKFHGKVRDARLSQGAIDVLAIVAYNQPCTVGEIDKLRGKPSRPLLSQLVRRELLAIEREEKQKLVDAKYRTTARFLSLFHLESIDELPQSVDVEIE